MYAAVSVKQKQNHKIIPVLERSWCNENPIYVFLEM